MRNFGQKPKLWSKIETLSKTSNFGQKTISRQIFDNRLKVEHTVVRLKNEIRRKILSF